MLLTKKFNEIVRYVKKSSLWVKLIILCICLIILIYLFKRMESRIETFDSSGPKYSIKRENIYDSFYSNIYDELVYSKKKNQYEILSTIKKTSIPKNSPVLDIGSGTGHHVDLFNSNGYKCTGLDISKDMVKKAQNNYKNHKFVLGDALKTITFPEQSFSMISCFYFTLYYIKNKRQFFGNCYYWLKSNGYLVLHLVDRELFDPIIPAGDPFVLISPQNYAKKRITSSVVKFNDFDYKANFNLNSNKQIGTLKETIKFKNSKKVRENEHIFYMQTQKEILSMAKEAGFILQSKIDLSRCQYDYQYIYILYKPN